jgi:hypothetical protein
MSGRSRVTLNDVADLSMANQLTLRAFMLQLSVELGRKQSDPLKWLSDFVSTLHTRLDANEKSLGPIASMTPAHEIARGNFDALGRELEMIFRPPPGAKNSR